MIPNQQIKLLRSWENDPFEELSISEIMELSKKRTKPWVFNSLQLLIKKGFLISKRKGNLDVYRLNWRNPLVAQVIQYLDIPNLTDFDYLDIIIETIGKIPLKNYCLIIFGSYAENKQKKDSDLDICFLVENRLTEKKIRPYFNEIKLNYAVRIDEHYITFADFVRMLLREEENLGKQIFRKHRLFFNADIYYQLIMGANKNGFRP